MNAKELVPDKQNAAILADVRNMLRELAAGSSFQPYLNIYRSLPRYADDAERDFGLDIYDRMVRDPAVNSAFETLRVKVLEQGAEIVPAIDAKIEGTGQDQAEADKAKEVRDFVAWAVSEMEEPLEDVLYTMLWGIPYGHTLSELVFDTRPYAATAASASETRYALRALDVKPRSVYRLVVDRHYRLEAVLAIIPDVGLAIPEGVLFDPKGWPNTVSPSKFCLFKMPGATRDPRGMSRFRAAYNAWWLKMQDWPLLLQWLSQVAGGALVGYTPEDQTQTGTDGVTPEDLMLAGLIKVRSGAAAAFRGGSKVDWLRPDGKGEQFWRSIEGFNREIFTAILTQARSHTEAQNGSKADSDSATDVLDSSVTWLRGLLARAVQRQVFETLVRLNLGDDAVKYTPRLHLFGSPDADWAANTTAAAAAGFTFTPLQQGEVASKRLGLSPDMEAVKARETQKQENEKAAAQKPAMTPGQEPNQPANPKPAKEKDAA